MSKTYERMTEAERKEKFGLVVKRGECVPEYTEAWTCCVIQSQLYYGNGVVPVEEHNSPDYTYSDLMKYVSDYPEQVVPGWFAPLTDWQSDLKRIRTVDVNAVSSDLQRVRYESLKYKYINDDMWEGQSETPLISFNDSILTCDEATTLYTEYLGDDDEKASTLLKLKNEAKTYIRNVVSKFLTEHAGKPEEPTFEVKYVN